MNNNKIGIQKRIKSFGFAFTGIFELVKSEPNAQIHLVASVCAITASIWLNISKTEWCIILIAIAIVWAAEGFNTCVEKLVDHLFIEVHETARIVKDISAGAVLICAIAAFIVGLIIFLPKIIA